MSMILFIVELIINGGYSRQVWALYGMPGK